MEPGYEYQTQQYGSPGQGAPQHWGADPGQPIRPKDAMTRARTGLVLLIAFITEVVVIAAADNQWVADKLAHADISTSSRLANGLRASALVFAWRFTPQHGDPSHFWAGSFALIGTTIVLSLLLIFAIGRGPVTFGRAFFGSWMAVVVATSFGTYVRALIVDLRIPNQGTRFEQAVYGVQSPSSITFVAGLGLGLVVAIVVGIVAPLTRRGPAVPLEAAVPVGTAPADTDFFGQSQSAPPWRAERFGPPPPSNVTVGNEQTTTLPSVDMPVGEQYSPPSSDAPTTALPVGMPGDGPDHSTTALPPSESLERGPREREATEPHQPFAAEASREYGDAPDSPYSTPSSGSSSSYAPLFAEPARSPVQEQSVHEPAESQMAAPEAAASESATSESATSEPESAATEQEGGSQGTAELPRLDEPSVGGTAQFPRPPDDEDIDPEHH